jgi:tetratricopeptide (TPR) repeat protein
MPLINPTAACLIGAALAWWVPNGANAQIFGQRTEATKCATAIGGSADRTIIQNICGIPPEIFEVLTNEFRKAQQDLRDTNQVLRDFSEAQKARLDELKKALELSDGQFRAAFEAFGERAVSPDQQLARLIDIAQRYRELSSLSQIQPGDTPVIVSLKAKSDDAIKSGRLSEAEAALAQIDAEQSKQEILLRENRARTTETRGTVAMQRIRYLDAAKFYAEAAMLLPDDDRHRETRLRLLFNEVSALYQQGDEFGDNHALIVAIDKQRRLIDLTPRARVPLDWAAAQNNLATTLSTLGTRESGTWRLEEAVAAYRAALQERTRTSVPLDWATTMMNLGIALSRLGDREGGTARLEEAVASYQAALEEMTRAREPLDWARAQINLGNALWRLGERESGTVRLEEAVTAYRAALEEMTRARVPLQWAGIQNNLGAALQTLGERGGVTSPLGEAVVAYRAALEERTRVRVPLDWAMTQNNLGTALQVLGESESGTAQLEEAVAAYRAALEEWTRERVPLQWARTQNNLGNALARLGERRSGTAQLEEAVISFRAALEERTRERVPLQWAATQNNLGNALQALGVRESGTARLEEAVAAYRAALEERTRERVPLDWLRTMTNLGYTRLHLGDFSGAALSLQEAVSNGGDAYSILWLYLANARSGGTDAKKHLANNAAGLTPAQWPFPVVELFLDRRTPADVLAATSKPAEQCEAQYYLGEWHLLQNERQTSIEALRKSMEMCPKGFIEFAGAVAELKRLGQ